MKNSKTNLKICKQGHKYFKSSDCPTCPICEKARNPKKGFNSQLSAPARRALENKGIKTLRQLSKLSEKEILELHGMGPGSIPKLRKILKAEGLSLKNKKLKTIANIGVPSFAGYFTEKQKL